MPEPQFGEMWEWDNWRMMFVRRGAGNDRATTYWIMLAYKDDMMQKWCPALLSKTPQPMASFGCPEWRRVEE